MAWIFEGKKFGQYTYEDRFDDEAQEEIIKVPENAGDTNDPGNNTDTDKLPCPQ